jgi:hypothetical protein
MLGIGFTPENVNVIVAKALELADEKQISISLSQKLKEKIKFIKAKSFPSNRAFFFSLLLL